MCRGIHPALRSAGGYPQQGVPHTLLLPAPTWKQWIFCLAPGKPLFPRILFLLQDSCISHWAQFLKASSTLGPRGPSERQTKPLGRRGGGGGWRAGELVELTVFQETQTSVLVSCGCCNKVQQTGWPETTGIYSLAVQAARRPKLRFQQGWFLLEAPKENLFHAPLLASGGCQRSLAFLGLWLITPIPASVFTRPSPLPVSVSSFLSLIRTHGIQGPFKARIISP